MGWAGITLVAVGALLTFYARFLLDTHTDWAEHGGGLVWSLVLAALILQMSWVGQVDARRDSSNDVRAHRWMIGLLSAFAFVLAGVRYPENALAVFTEEALHSSDLGPLLAWTGVCSVALGGALYCAGRRVPRARPRRFPAFGLLSGLSVLVLGLVFLVPITLRVPFEHTVADGVGHGADNADNSETAQTPGTVTRVGWTWRPPEGVRSTEVTPTPHGALVHLEDGFVLLDGASGAERWTLRMHHSPQVVPGATLDGTWAWVFHSRGPKNEHGDGEGWVTVAETATGEISEWRLPEGVGSWNANLEQYVPFVVEDLLITGYRKGGTRGVAGLRAYDLVTGETRWTHDPPERCLNSRYDEIDPLVLDRLVLLGHQCWEEGAVRAGGERGASDEEDRTDSWAVAALDPRTGEPLWWWERETGFDVERSGLGGWISVEMVGTGPERTMVRLDPLGLPSGPVVDTGSGVEVDLGSEAGPDGSGDSEHSEGEWLVQRADPDNTVLTEWVQGRGLLVRHLANRVGSPVETDLSLTADEYAPGVAALDEAVVVQTEQSKVFVVPHGGEPTEITVEDAPATVLPQDPQQVPGGVVVHLYPDPGASGASGLVVGLVP